MKKTNFDRCLKDQLQEPDVAVRFKAAGEGADLLTALAEVCGNAEDLVAWLRQPNRAFASRAPLDLIRDGESYRLWEMVHQVRQGVFA